MEMPRESRVEPLRAWQLGEVDGDFGGLFHRYHMREKAVGTTHAPTERLDAIGDLRRATFNGPFCALHSAMPIAVAAARQAQTYTSISIAIARVRYKPFGLSWQPRRMAEPAFPKDLEQSCSR
jgi:hypothetical protein